MADRKQDLSQTYIFHGKRYGPGKGVMVPEDFPKTPPVRKAGASATFRPGTSGSGISLEDAPEGSGVTAEGTFQLAQGGKLPGESEEEFQARAAEDDEFRMEQDTEARAAAVKSIKDANKPATAKPKKDAE